MNENEGVELAQWLQESGRRKPVRGCVEMLYAQSPTVESPDLEPQRHVTQPALLYLFAIAAVSYLIFYFLNVGLDIGEMSSIIVFIREHLS